MAQRSAEPRFLRAASAWRRCPTALIDHLDRDGPLEPAIHGAVDDAHAAGAEERLNPIRSNVLANGDEQVILCGHGDNRNNPPHDFSAPRKPMLRAVPVG